MKRIQALILDWWGERDIEQIADFAGIELGEALNVLGDLRRAGYKLPPKLKRRKEGDEWVEHNKTGNYWVKKVGGKTVLLCHYLWENHYGPLTSGIRIKYIDGNSLNCTIGNLRLAHTPEARKIIYSKAHKRKANEPESSISNCRSYLLQAATSLRQAEYCRQHPQKETRGKRH